MSYLSIALQRQMERRQMNQGDLAKQSGISRSYISRLLSSEFHELSDANFTSLLKAFSADPIAQAELVAARCLDARVGPGSELVDVIIKGKPNTSQAAPGTSEFPQVELDAETARAFAFLKSQCPVNHHLQKHIVSYAKMLGMP